MSKQLLWQHLRSLNAPKIVPYNSSISVPITETNKHTLDKKTPTSRFKIILNTDTMTDFATAEPHWCSKPALSLHFWFDPVEVFGLIRLVVLQVQILFRTGNSRDSLVLETSPLIAFLVRFGQSIWLDLVGGPPSPDSFICLLSEEHSESRYND